MEADLRRIIYSKQQLSDDLRDMFMYPAFRPVVEEAGAVRPPFQRDWLSCQMPSVSQRLPTPAALSLTTSGTTSSRR